MLSLFQHVRGDRLTAHSANCSLRKYNFLQHFGTFFRMVGKFCLNSAWIVEISARFLLAHLQESAQRCLFFPILQIDSPKSTLRFQIRLEDCCFIFCRSRLLIYIEAFFPFFSLAFEDSSTFVHSCIALVWGLCFSRFWDI